MTSLKGLTDNRHVERSGARFGLISEPKALTPNRVGPFRISPKYWFGADSGILETLPLQSWFYGFLRTGTGGVENPSHLLRGPTKGAGPLRKVDGPVGAFVQAR